MNTRSNNVFNLKMFLMYWYSSTAEHYNSWFRCWRSYYKCLCLHSLYCFFLL